MESLLQSKIQSQKDKVMGAHPEVELVSPCKLGEGILQATSKEKQYLINLFEKEKFSSCFFIPASGSGSRMFQFLFDFLEMPNEDNRSKVEKFLNHITDFAFFQQLPIEIRKKLMTHDIDLDEFGNTPEDMAKMQAKLAEQLAEKMKAEAEQQQQQAQDEPKPKRKTKKQEEKEQQQKLDEQLKLKSLRDIYIGLVKMLHPDGESDEDKRLEKEELMKQVTTAYDNKDLPTLLKLELMWVHKESKDIDKLSAEKLKIYINFLRERKKELEREAYSFKHNPRFQPIADLGHLTEKKAFESIHMTVVQLHEKKATLLRQLPFEQNANIIKLKKAAIKYAKRLYDEIQQSDMMDDFMSRFNAYFNDNDENFFR